MNGPPVRYVPCLLNPANDEIAYQAGAFPTEELAQQVLETWLREGRTEPMAINILPMYETLADWESDR